MINDMRSQRFFNSASEITFFLHLNYILAHYMLKKDTIILGIESSCDDTGAALLKNGKLLANIIAGQEVHAAYGGVVPELASRAHQRNIVPTVEMALREAGISKAELSAVAYTKGPGLMGSLLVGSSFAKSMALGLGIPSIGVDHMRGHILAHFIRKEGGNVDEPRFPFLSLTVSGGHTQLVLVRSLEEMEVLGKTLDDAAGEAFDKTAKMIGLAYPGGPLIDKHAQIGKPIFSFNKPKIAGLDMSFSGLKTSILYFLKDQIKREPNFIELHLNDICASVQNCIVEILIEKSAQAIRIHKPLDIALAGGVAANSGLRSAFVELASDHHLGCHIPAFEYCTDNAAMIGMAGHFLFEKGVYSGVDTVPSANLSL
jgi:N6-L-threonylcarbamoyladenine synthase